MSISIELIDGQVIRYLNELFNLKRVPKNRNAVRDAHLTGLSDDELHDVYRMMARYGWGKYTRKYMNRPHRFRFQDLAKIFKKLTDPK